MTKTVGECILRVDAYDKVTGRAAYTADIRMPGMLYAGLVRSPIRHGLLRGVDPSKALAVAGVRAVFTADDIPGKLDYGAPYEDHPILAYDRVRFIGDSVAIVVAESRESLDLALGLVDLDYEELPVVDSPEEALREGVPSIHPDGNLIEQHRVGCGDVEVGFQQATHIVEGEYKTDWQEHAALEPEAVIAYLDDEGLLTVLAPSQNPFSVRATVAQTIGLAPDEVRILQPDIGGSFGGKNDFVYQLSAQAALAAWHLRRPVSLVISREESMLAGNKRHPMTIRHRTGVTEDGRICAAEVHMLADGGAYAATSAYVIWRAVAHACGPYAIPNVRAVAQVCYTNSVPAGSMRGFGSSQAIYAAERHMDKVARTLGLDPVDFRRSNLLRVGDTTITDEQLTASVGLEAALDRALELSDYYERRRAAQENPPSEAHTKKGFGIALSQHGVSLGAGEGRDYAGAILEVSADGRVICETGMTDLGTGVLTALTQIAAESMSVPADRVIVHRVDTSVSPESNKTVASRSTFVGGMAVQKAAVQLKELLEETAASCLAVGRERIRLEDGRFRDRDAPDGEKLGLAELAAWAQSQGIALRSAYHHELPPLEWNHTVGQGEAYYCHGFGAQVAEVSVDQDTGKVNIDRLAVVVDCGRAINPDMVLGQIYGGAVMGAGYALMEELGLENGRIANRNFDEYLILTAADVGEVLADWVEAPAAGGPFGAKGIAELTAVGVAPAILNAIVDAKGTQLDDIPANLERVLLGHALSKSKTGGR